MRAIGRTVVAVIGTPWATALMLGCTILGNVLLFTKSGKVAQGWTGVPTRLLCKAARRSDGPHVREDAMGVGGWVSSSMPYLTARGAGQADAWSAELAERGRQGSQRVV